MAELDDDSIAASLASVRSTVDGPGALVLHLSGEIDIASVPPVRDAIDRIFENEPPSTIAFDLAGLTFLDSSGLALLLTIAQQVESVEVRNPTAMVRRVIELSGLATTLPMTAEK